jgi:flagellar M-ring protein FliF
LNKEKLKGYLDKVKTALGKVSKKIWILLAVVLVVAVAAVVLLYNNRPYAVLIDGANNEETSTVISWLGEQGVTDFRMEGTGTILVPQAQAAGLKAKLLQEQYSQNKSSFSGYFERVGALSTQYDRRVAKLESLTEEIRSTIRQFPGVRDASVNINEGEDRGYVLDTNKVVNATATVMLTMEKGKMLDGGQANAIRNYISHSVAGLKPEDVSIEDTIGNDYNSTIGSGGNATTDSALKLQLEKEWSNRIRTQIMNFLTDIYGEGNATAMVNCNVELGNKTVNKHEVELPKFAQDGSTGGRGIIGSEFYAFTFNTPDEGGTGGVVGTPSNAQLPTYVEPGDIEAQLQSILDQEANRVYDNTTTDTEMIIRCGTLTDVTVSVAINTRGANGETIPVDVEEMRGVVASGAGIIPVATEDMTAQEYLSARVFVLATPFPETEEPVDPTPTPPTILGIPYWVFIAAGAGLLLFVLVLTVILLLRRKKRKKLEEEQKAVEELLAASMPGEVEIGPDGQPIVQPVLDEDGNPVAGANVMDLHTERSMELRQNIRDYVDENMEVAALLIKSWLKEDGDNG